MLLSEQLKITDNVSVHSDYNKFVIDLLNKASDISCALKSAKMSSPDIEKYNMILK